MIRTATGAGISNNSSPMLTLLSATVVSAGIGSIGFAAASQALAGDQAWLAMIGITLLFSPIGAVKIPGVKAHVSLGELVSFTCAILFGPSAAVIAAAADGVAISLRVTRTVGKFSYNVASNSVSMAIAALVTTSLFPSFGQRTNPLPGSEIAGAMAVLVLCYFLCTTLLISAYLSVARDLRFFSLWRENAFWTSISFVASGAAALAAYSMVDRFGYYVFGIVTGLMVVISLFYRTYSRKVEGANERADRQEEITFKTIETVIASMGGAGYAIKMNVRRVELLALVLGRAAGCSDEEIRDLRAAALLHDVGNIVVPPHILEKPGELTREEFDKVRQHAEFGARMVEAMGFSKDVAAIIQHHHERFDGKGYPDGLAGDRIPRPARVLAIVDSYNALTVDRPHRPRMTCEDALEVLKAGSGKAFDPAILKRFLSLVTKADEEAHKAQSYATTAADLQDEIRRRRKWNAA